MTHAPLRAGVMASVTIELAHATKAGVCVIDQPAAPLGQYRPIMECWTHKVLTDWPHGRETFQHTARKGSESASCSPELGTRYALSVPTETVSLPPGLMLTGAGSWGEKSTWSNPLKQYRRRWCVRIKVYFPPPNSKNVAAVKHLGCVLPQPRCVL